MAVTWTFTEVNIDGVGRARFNDERGNRGVRGVLSASGTYTTAGDNLPVLHFKEVRIGRVASILPNTRTVTDGVLASSTTVTSATAAFTAADIGKRIDSIGIPANTYISAVGSATSVTISAAATVTTTAAQLTIGGKSTTAGRSVADSVTNSTTTVTSATAAFTAADVGVNVTGTNIPTGTTIASVTNGTTIILSAAATGAGSGGTLVIGPNGATLARPHRQVSLTAIIVAGVPGKVRLFTATTGEEVSNGTDVTSSAFLVDLLGK